MASGVNCEHCGNEITYDQVAEFATRDKGLVYKCNKCKKYGTASLGVYPRAWLPCHIRDNPNLYPHVKDWRRFM
jgi:hypothetical protein